MNEPTTNQWNVFAASWLRLNAGVLFEHGHVWESAALCTVMLFVNIKWIDENAQPKPSESTDSGEQSHG